jgi:hypothetical protein
MSIIYIISDELNTIIIGKAIGTELYNLIILKKMFLRNLTPYVNSITFFYTK